MSQQRVILKVINFMNFSENQLLVFTEFGMFVAKINKFGDVDGLSLACFDNGKLFYDFAVSANIEPDRSIFKLEEIECVFNSDSELNQLGIELMEDLGVQF